MGVALGSGVGVGVAVAVGFGVGVPVTAGVAIATGSGVGVGVAVAVGFGVGVPVTAGVAIATGSGVGVAVCVAVVTSVGVGAPVGLSVGFGVGSDGSLQALRTTAMARTVKTAIQRMRRVDTVISVVSPHVVLELPGAKPVAACSGDSALAGYPLTSTLSSVRIVAIRATCKFLPTIPHAYQLTINFRAKC